MAGKDNVNYPVSTEIEAITSEGKLSKTNI